MTGPVRVLRRWSRVLIFGAAAVWIASLWDPFYVDGSRMGPLHSTGQREVASLPLVEREGSLAFGETIGRISLLEAASQPPSDALERALCARLDGLDKPAAFGPGTASVLITLSAGGFTETRQVAVGEDAPVACLPLPDGVVFPRSVRLVVEGASVLDPPSWTSLVGRVDVSWVQPLPLSVRPWADRAVDITMLTLPMLVAMLIVILIAFDVGAVGAVGAAGRESLVSGSGGALLAGVLVLTVGLAPLHDRARSQVVTPAEWTGPQTPAGELVDGAVIRQPVRPEQLPEQEAVAATGGVCIEVFVATYLDRANEGEVVIALQDRRSDLPIAPPVVLPAGDLQDNSWESACFRIADPAVLAEPLDVVLAGRGSPSGRAVTAWLRPALLGEDAARVSGTAGAPPKDGMVLRYRFGLATRPLHEGAVRFLGATSVLAGAAGLGGAVLATRTRRRVSR